MVRETRLPMDDIQGVLIRFINAFSRLDLDEMMSCYADDATAFFPIAHRTTFIDGKEEIRKAFANVIAKVHAAGLNSLKMEPEDVKIQKLGDTAIATFQVRDDDLSRRTLVLRREQEYWVIQHLHASNAPLEETV